MAKAFTQDEFLILVWILTGVSLCLLGMRLVVRRKVFGCWKVDDALVCLAAACLLGITISDTISLHTTLLLQEVALTHETAPPDLAAISDSSSREQWGIAYTFFTGIWAVKGSFLAFYDSLTQRLPKYRKAWWATNVLTILTYIGCLFSYAFLDGLKPGRDFTNVAIKYEFSADLVTDVFITAIPLTLALRSQINTKQKLALTGIFSLSLVVTVFSIARFTQNLGRLYPTWLRGWSIIELSVAVSFACLISFRALAVSSQSRNSKKSKAKRYYIPGSSKGSSKSHSQRQQREQSSGHNSNNPNDGFSLLASEEHLQQPRIDGYVDVELAESPHTPHQQEPKSPRDWTRSNHILEPSPVAFPRASLRAL